MVFKSDLKPENVKEEKVSQGKRVNIKFCINLNKKKKLLIGFDKYYAVCLLL